MSTGQNKAAAETVKQCCATLYESGFARLLLGESFHSDGLALTVRLGDLLQLAAGDRVLDVASGKLTTALFVAERFGCEVRGAFGLTSVDLPHPQKYEKSI